jgi:hypothetical protein
MSRDLVGGFKCKMYNHPLIWWASYGWKLLLARLLIEKWFVVTPRIFLWCRLIISIVTKYSLSFFVRVVLINQHQKYYFCVGCLRRSTPKKIIFSVDRIKQPTRKYHFWTKSKAKAGRVAEKIETRSMCAEAEACMTHFHDLGSSTRSTSATCFRDLIYSTWFHQQQPPLSGLLPTELLPDLSSSLLLYTLASDVYSFRVLLLELLTSKPPFQDLLQLGPRCPCGREERLQWAHDWYVPPLLLRLWTTILFPLI